MTQTKSSSSIMSIDSKEKLHLNNNVINASSSNSQSSPIENTISHNETIHKYSRTETSKNINKGTNDITKHQSSRILSTSSYPKLFSPLPSSKLVHSSHSSLSSHHSSSPQSPPSPSDSPISPSDSPQNLPSSLQNRNISNNTTLTRSHSSPVSTLKKMTQTQMQPSVPLHAKASSPRCVPRFELGLIPEQTKLQRSLSPSLASGFHTTRAPSTPSGRIRMVSPLHSTLLKYGNLTFLVTDAPTNNTIPHYLELLKYMKANVVVRVCSQCYDPQPIVDNGFKFMDLCFDDSQPPPKQVIKKWLDAVETEMKENKTRQPNSGSCENGCTVAIHCIAGMGRSCVLVGMALIEMGMDSNDVVSFIRTKRKGAFTSHQVQYILQYSPIRQQQWRYLQ